MARQRRLRSIPAALLVLLLALALAPEFPVAPPALSWTSAGAPLAHRTHADRQPDGELVAAGAPSATLAGVAQHAPRVSSARGHASPSGAVNASTVLPAGGWRAWPVAPRAASHRDLLAGGGWRSRAPPRQATRSI